jgi:hypothetical protein
MFAPIPVAHPTTSLFDETLDRVVDDETLDRVVEALPSVAGTMAVQTTEPPSS